MSRAVRELKSGEVVIGLMTRYGKQIGEFADPAVGHDVLMDPERKKTISEFLEARRIDFFGRKSAIANLEPEFIEKLVAVRQIELAASQCVSMWLDLDMAGAEMFEFARISLL